LSGGGETIHLGSGRNFKTEGNYGKTGKKKVEKQKRKRESPRQDWLKESESLTKGLCAMAG